MKRCRTNKSRELCLHLVLKDQIGKAVFGGPAEMMTLTEKPTDCLVWLTCMGPAFSQSLIASPSPNFTCLLWSRKEFLKLFPEKAGRARPA